MNAPYEMLGLINHDAERAVLAAMRDDSAIAIELVDKLEAGDFCDVRRQVAFEAISNLLARPDVIDTPAIVAECLNVAEIRGFRDVRLTAQEIDSLSAPNANVALQASTVKRLAWLRRAGEFAFWLTGELQQRPEPNDLFTAAQERWQHIAPAQDNTQFVYGWDTRPLHEQVIKQREQERAEGTRVVYDWPWASWNRMVRPLRGGFVGIIAAADGIGKTTYLEQIAEHWAGQKIQTIYVHLEDALDYKLDRRLARTARVHINAIEDGALSAEDRVRIRDANETLDELAPFLHYYHAAGETMASIIRELESKAREGICQAVVFDYLDKVQPTRTSTQLFGSNVWERQAADMEALKVFAERAGIPVLTATQGNKQMQMPGTQTRQAIQGTGQKSQKSQLVVILSRELVGAGGQKDQTGTVIAKEGEYSPVVQVRVDKQNRGATGQFAQVLIGQYFSVADVRREP